MDRVSMTVPWWGFALSAPGILALLLVLLLLVARRTGRRAPETGPSLLAAPPPPEPRPSPAPPLQAPERPPSRATVIAAPVGADRTVVSHGQPPLDDARTRAASAVRVEAPAL